VICYLVLNLVSSSHAVSVVPYIPVVLFFFFPRLPLRSTLFPYTTLFRSERPGWMTSLWFRSLRSIPNHEAAALRHLHAGCICCGSEEHTSELQSHLNIVCRLLLEKKNNTTVRLQGARCGHTLVVCRMMTR